MQRNFHLTCREPTKHFTAVAVVCSSTLLLRCDLEIFSFLNEKITEVLVNIIKCNKTKLKLEETRKVKEVQKCRGKKKGENKTKNRQ